MFKNLTIKNLMKIMWVKICVAIFLVIIGVTTVALAIMQLVNDTGFDSTFAIRIITGVACMVFGVTEFIIGLTKSDENASLKESIAGAIIIGVGVFLCLPAAFSILNTLVGYMLPILVACGGFAIAIKGVITAFQKAPLKKWLVFVVVGAIIGTLGVIFTVFYEKLSNVIWLILGCGIALGGIADILIIINDYKTKKKTNIEQKIEKPVESEKVEKSAPKAIEAKVEVKSEKIEKPVTKTAEVKAEIKSEKVEKSAPKDTKVEAEVKNKKVETSKPAKAKKSNKTSKTTKTKK